MATDIHLQIDGIKGESADTGHVGWIEILSGNFGVRQPKSATSSTGGGHTAERAEIEDFHFHKLADLTTVANSAADVRGRQNLSEGEGRNDACGWCRHADQVF